MIFLEMKERFFLELGKCKHYELKCKQYKDIDEDKYNRYLHKLQLHKKLARRYYEEWKASLTYTDFLDVESPFWDSQYFEPAN